ncbi:MAG: host-nuclease inhibitor Gam family protein [bacterium]|nr:host-nuclease inhibitor Gam family protein [bacterium]
MKVTVKPVPQSPAALERCVGLIGELTRRRDRALSSLNDRIAREADATAKQIAPIDAQIDELVAGVAAYAEAHRDELTNGGKTKTVKLLTGVLSWRNTPPAVRLTKVANVLALLKERGLTQFIRTKEEVNKEALLAEPEIATTIKGVSITQREELFIKPNDATEVPAEKKRMKKAA